MRLARDQLQGNLVPLRREVFAGIAEQHRILTEVSALIDAGVLRTTLAVRAGKIDATTLRKVHRQIESGAAFGKIVLAGF